MELTTLTQNQDASKPTHVIQSFCLVNTLFFRGVFHVNSVTYFLLLHSTIFLSSLFYFNLFLVHFFLFLLTSFLPPIGVVGTVKCPFVDFTYFPMTFFFLSFRSSRKMSLSSLFVEHTVLFLCSSAGSFGPNHNYPF